MEFFEAMKNRRSYYNINNEATITDERLIQLLSDSVQYVPSAFNSKSSRALLLLGDNHNKLWNIVLETLRKLVPAEQFESTELKIASFAAGHGTVLFFEDQDIVTGLQKQFPLYSDNFPIWSLQSGGMLQYVVWTGLEQEGMGASLQHYNPLIDDEVKRVFDIPSSWKLMAQMPFGKPVSQPDPMDRGSVEDRIRIYR